MARRPIPPVDTIWLNMDRENNLMVNECLMMLEAPVDWDRFMATWQRRVIESYPVFSQQPVASRLPLAAPYWEDTTDFDASRHVVRATLPAPGDDAALQDYVSAQISVPLERDRPLWQLHLIDGYGDGAVVLARLHHAMADGIALTRVVLSLTHASPDDDLAEEPPAARPQRSLLGSTAHLAGVATTALLDAGRMITPANLPGTVSLAQQTVGVTTKLLLGRNPDSAVAGDPGVHKRVVWAPPIPLEEIRGTAHRTGTTINDVLVAALAGALNRYQGHHDDEPVDIPTMVPVNVRPLDEPLPRELGNRFALVLLSLPSGLDSSAERLRETKRRMDVIKRSPEAFLTFELIQGIGRTGPDLERLAVDFFANKASGVTTNVPGPRERRYVAGTRITAMLGWAPESGKQTLGTAIFSYDGSVFVGFKVDTGVIADPEDLMTEFLAEVDSLCGLAQADLRPA
jgi:WS/DGAT/MGAT family acyltransferase